MDSLFRGSPIPGKRGGDSSRDLHSSFKKEEGKKRKTECWGGVFKKSSSAGSEVFKQIYNSVRQGQGKSVSERPGGEKDPGTRKKKGSSLGRINL